MIEGDDQAAGRTLQDSVGGDQPSSDEVSSSRMAMQIYGKFTEGEVKLAEECHDPSQNPLPPVATFLPPAFGRVMSALKAKGMPAVAIVVHKKEAFFSAAEGEVRFELSLTAENGLKWNPARSCRRRFHCTSGRRK
ncbi:hypothetical protein DM860_014693 [Cuscuta australis]|uniref:Uncharacterized protein n=1 Tax=Cuscuta australis TaxID=267555 RepID=A0A328DMN0_9ASTE|nr:hypothetical protein DM860_014693 [Cuscuta australis]